MVDTRVWLVPLAVLCGSVAPALGQSLEYRVTPQVGGAFPLVDLPTDFRIDGPDHLIHEHQLDPAMLYGLTLGLRFMDAVAVEGSFSWAPTDLVPASRRGRGVDVDVYTYAVSALVFHRMARFAPYVAGGIGGKSYDWERPGAGNEHDIALQFGGGVEYEVTPSLALRLDVRDHISQFGAELEGGEKVILHDLLLRAGLTFSRRAGETTVAALAAKRW